MLEMKYRPVSELKELAGNPRIIKKEQFEKLKTSIKDNADYFEARPIILSDRTGELVVIAGNQRLKASKALGLAEVPTVLLEGLSEEREREIIIRDNVENGEWDMDILANEWDAEKLGEWGVDLPAPKLFEEGKLGRDFLFLPTTVLDARKSEWQNRKKIWGTLFQSQKGRGENLLGFSGSSVMEGYTSIFDPVLCELCYRWFGKAGGSVLDPFAGGSVRGIVCGVMGMEYFGNDLSEKQVSEDLKQSEDVKNILGDYFVSPQYNTGDSADISSIVEKKSKNKKFDMIMSCPPYADLEVYSDKDNDLSNMDYDDFLENYRKIIRDSCSMLKENRFAVFVVGEIRDKSGEYRNFVGDTIKAFQDAGLRYYNHAILIGSTGNAGVRARRNMRMRKLVHQHQDVIVAVKGEPEEDSRIDPMEFAEQFNADGILDDRHEEVLVFSNASDFSAIKNEYAEINFNLQNHENKPTARNLGDAPIIAPSSRFDKAS